MTYRKNNVVKPKFKRLGLALLCTGFISLTYIEPAFAQDSLSDGEALTFVNLFLGDAYKVARGMFLVGCIGLAIVLFFAKVNMKWAVLLITGGILVNLAPSLAERFFDNESDYQVSELFFDGTKVNSTRL